MRGGRAPGRGVRDASFTKVYTAVSSTEDISSDATTGSNGADISSSSDSASTDNTVDHVVAKNAMQDVQKGVIDLELEHKAEKSNESEQVQSLSSSPTGSLEEEKQQSNTNKIDVYDRRTKQKKLAQQEAKYKTEAEAFLRSMGIVKIL